MIGGRLLFAISVQLRQMAGATVQLQWRVGVSGAHGFRLPRGGSTQASGSEVLGSNQEYRQYGEDIGVPGGQLTLDLIAAHNQDFPSNKVSLADLKPNSDPDFQCKGTEPLKNGFLTCGCHVRA